MTAEALRDALAARIQKALELNGDAHSNELRAALEDLARDTADVYLRQLAGEKLELEVAALKARVEILKSASVLIGVSVLQDAVWEAINGAFQDLATGLNR